MSRPLTFLRNFAAGEYGLFERLRRTAANLGRRRPNQGCCGHYGEPGC